MHLYSAQRFVPLILLSGIPVASAIFSFNSTIRANNATADDLFDGTIPSSALSASCAVAYAASVDCSSDLLFLDNDAVNSTQGGANALETIYEAACSQTCYASLRDWRSNLVQACQSDYDSLSASGNSSSLEIPGAGDDTEQFGNAFTTTEEVWLDWVFWDNCLRDVNTGLFCALTIQDTRLSTWPSVELFRYQHLSRSEAFLYNQTFCADASCFMQQELVNVAIDGEFQGIRATVQNVLDRIAETCTTGNVTDQFPILGLGRFYATVSDDTKITSEQLASGQVSGGSKREVGLGLAVLTGIWAACAVL